MSAEIGQPFEGLPYLVTCSFCGETLEEDDAVEINVYMPEEESGEIDATTFYSHPACYINPFGEPTPNSKPVIPPQAEEDTP